MCDTFGHPLYVSTCFDSIHFDPRHGSAQPALHACMDGIAQISKASRALDKLFFGFPPEKWKNFKQLDGERTLGWGTLIALAGLTPFLMEHLVRSGNQKKKTRFAGLFFLTGLRPVLPLGQCPPSKPYTL